MNWMDNMRKYIILLGLLSFSCSSYAEENNKKMVQLASLQADIEKYQASKSDLENQINVIKNSIAYEQSNYNNLPQIKKQELDRAVTDLSAKKQLLLSDVTGLEKQKSDLSKRYIVRLKLKQSRVSLSLTEHAKDAMNAVEFDMPVDKQFYDSVNVGSELVDKFRSGSFIMNGSFSSWKVTVVGKAER